jgi:hypothetical protein
MISCDKYNSKITGKVFYTDVNDNTDYPAAGAVVTKMVQKGDSLHSVVAVFANENGEFLFDHTTKGAWILSGKFEIEVDSVIYFYSGFSENFTTNGDDQVEKIIILKPTVKDDTE